MSLHDIPRLIVTVGIGVLVVGCTAPQDTATMPAAGAAVSTLPAEDLPAQETTLSSPRAAPGGTPILATSPTPAPIVLSPGVFDATPSPTAMPFATPTYDLILIPTNTPESPSPTNRLDATLASPSDTTDGSPLDTYRARGSFTTQTSFADGSVTEQSGHFEVAHVTVHGPYESDEFYTLTTVRDGGDSNTITVYQIGDRIAVDYGDGEWLATPRGQGSSFAKAIQPVVDLPDAFLSLLDRADKVGEQLVDDRLVIHYRIADTDLFPKLFSRWLPVASGTLVWVQFDAWIAQEKQYVVKYEFQAELANAPALDSEFTSVTANRSVHWVYEVYSVDPDLAISWPENARIPGSIQIPGFKSGTFPLPPDAEITNNYVGLPELISEMDESEVVQFYKKRLDALGWSIQGEYGLYTLRNGRNSLLLIIEADPTSQKTRISILSED